MIQVSWCVHRTIPRMQQSRRGSKQYLFARKHQRQFKLSNKWCARKRKGLLVCINCLIWKGLCSDKQERRKERSPQTSMPVCAIQSLGRKVLYKQPQSLSYQELGLRILMVCWILIWFTGTRVPAAFCINGSRRGNHRSPSPILGKSSIDICGHTEMGRDQRRNKIRFRAHI